MTAHASVLLILGRFSHAEEVYRTVLDMRCVRLIESPSPSSHKEDVAVVINRMLQ